MCLMRPQYARSRPGSRGYRFPSERSPVYGAPPCRPSETAPPPPMTPSASAARRTSSWISSPTTSRAPPGERPCPCSPGPLPRRTWRASPRPSPRSPPGSCPPSWRACSTPPTTCTTRATWGTRCPRRCRWPRCVTSSPRCSTTAWPCTRWAPSPPPWSTTCCAGWPGSSGSPRARRRAHLGRLARATSPRCSPRARPRPGYRRVERRRHAGPPLTVLVAETAHYCVARSHAGHGLGRRRRHPRARGRALPAARRRPSRARSPPPPAPAASAIAVVASAGSTATGAFDPLDAVADFCERHGLWFHVDGAHGACAALSPATATR